MEIIIIYAIFCIVVGWLGSSTTLGFGSAFLLSILLTPVVGFVICLFYPSAENQNKRLAEQQKQTELLRNISSGKLSHADEIEKLKKQMDDGVITADEFAVLKGKIING